MRILKKAVITMIMGAGALSGCADTNGSETAKGAVPYQRPGEIVIYSPAPPKIMLHGHNIEFGEMLATCGVAEKVTVIPMALPASINVINTLPPDQKPFHLPIITTLDYQTSVNNTAPVWHGYDRRNDDLLFVGRLYDVAYGIMAFDSTVQNPQDLAGKRLGVPPRPSAVRWFTESLLRDGWGVIDDVELVDILPPQLGAALARGEIDATSWNIMSETPNGYLPMVPALVGLPNAHWIDIDEAGLQGVLEKNDFPTERISVKGLGVQIGNHAPNMTPLNDPKFLSFAQGLAAWKSTPKPLVQAISQCFKSEPIGFGAGGKLSERQFEWPGLADTLIHPDAKQ